MENEKLATRTTGGPGWINRSFLVAIAFMVASSLFLCAAFTQARAAHYDNAWLFLANTVEYLVIGSVFIPWKKGI